MNKRWAKLAAVVVAAAFIGSALTLELYFNSRATEMDVDVVDIAIQQFGRAAMWALLAPLILMIRSPGSSPALNPGESSIGVMMVR